MKNIPHQVEYGQSVINFSLQFSDRKTVAISVHPDCQVIVAAPNDADLSKVQELVHKRARWIQKQQRYFQQFLPRTPARSYVSGETHLYLGRQYRIKLVTADKPLFKFSGGYLIIHHPDTSLADNVEEVLYSWYVSKLNKSLGSDSSFASQNFLQNLLLLCQRIKNCISVK